MATETILQHWVVTKFILPFVLVTGIVYAILEKTNILGEKAHQINGIVAGVIGLVFVGAVYPKLVVENLVLFLTVAVVVVFIGLLLWGFLSGSDLKEGVLGGKASKIIVIIAIVIVVGGAVIWATGAGSNIFDLLFKQSWSDKFWTNFFFVVVIAAVLALVLRSKGLGGE